MDKIDREILDGIAAFEAQGKTPSTYDLAGFLLKASKIINGESHSVGNTDSNFRYHSKKLWREGLITRTEGTNGKQKRIWLNLVPEGFAVSDGSLILLKSPFLTEFFCPYTAKCHNCQPPDAESGKQLVFKPLKLKNCFAKGNKQGKTHYKKYVALTCQFLTEILSATLQETQISNPNIDPDTFSLYEAQQQLFRVLKKSKLEITVSA